jgi:ABC-type multidrug transport system fused ATPase/permease subunit
VPTAELVGGDALLAGQAKPPPAAQRCYDECGWASRTFWGWIWPTVRLGATRQLGPADLPPLPRFMQLGPQLARIDRAIATSRLGAAMRGDPEPAGGFSVLPDKHLLGVFVRVYWPVQLSLTCVCCLKEGLNMAIPMLLREMVLFVQHPTAPAWRGFAIAAATFAANLVQCYATHAPMVESFNIGNKLKATTMSLVFRKSLRLSNEARQGSSAGQIVNLMANDAQRFCEFVPMLNDMLLCGPFLLISMSLIYSMLGAACFAGVAVMGLGMLVNSKLMRRLKALRSQQMGQTDQRVLQTNEALLGIRVVKCNCWEDAVAARIGDFRKVELRRIRSMERLMAVLRFNSFAVPVLLSLVVFSAYVYSGGVMHAADIFSAMALFSMVQQYMSYLPGALGMLGQMLVSQKRLETFLHMSEQPTGGDSGVARADAPPVAGAGAVRIRGGAFSWTDASGARDLDQIDFEASAGQLVAVIGSVGAGKSTLCAACLGELHRLAGSHRLEGTVALCAQQPWLSSGTLRENVLFGNVFDHERYWAAIRRCGLMPDLEQLPEGDRTAIGNRGINLSGGQKQRIALARAVYRAADINILDDVLSAVDVHVGKLLFDECICGAMERSTRILVTNNLQILERCDRVVVVERGRIVEAGSAQQLLVDPASVVSTMRRAGGVSKEQAAAEHEEKEIKTVEADEMQVGIEKQLEGKTASKDGVLGKPEARVIGKVLLSVYGRWLKFGSSGALLILLFLFGFVGSELGFIMSQIWISLWASDAAACSAVSSADDCEPLMRHTTAFWTLAYGAISALAIILVFWRNWIWASSVVKSASELHRLLLANILRQPTQFFDETPTGTILNRFASDVDMVDTTLSSIVQRPVEFLIKGTMALCTVAAVVPALLLPLLVLTVPYFKIRELFRRSDRELRRLDSTTRSPIFSHFSEMLAGVTTLRAFGEVEAAKDINERLLTANLQTAFHQRQVHGWVSLRLDIVGAALTLAATCACVLFRASLTPSIAGLMLLQLAQAVRYYRWAAKMSVDLESKMVYVERILQYIDLPPEPPLRLPSDPTSGFPGAGSVSFSGVCLRYRPGLPLALCDASFLCRGGSRVGICGRTGAGKSTLAAALFRLVPLAGGTIEIDGHNIARLGLHTLRQALAVIPQDPSLFAGSLRHNLDPFDQASDKELAATLGQVGLTDWVARSGGINMMVAECGGNISVGQRQMVCMARALLRQAAVLLMDEATASIDYDTDRQIQQSTRSMFAGTVLTIAHRLHTIMDCDQIVVLEAGRVVEVGTPALLVDKPGHLQKLVDAGGPAEAAKLRSIAGSVT